MYYISIQQNSTVFKPCCPVKKLFSENAEQLAVTMDVSSDRYCSLFATGKDNQAASDAKVNEALHSLYDSMQ